MDFTSLAIFAGIAIAVIGFIVVKKQNDKKEADARAERTKALEVAIKSTSPADAAAITALQQVANRALVALQQSVPASQLAPVAIATKEDYVPHPESNTPDWKKYTDLSPGGFPVWYPTVKQPDGTVTVNPSIPPMLVFDGTRHFSEQDIIAYRAGVAARVNVDRQNSLPTPLTGPIEASTLDDDDWAYLVAMAGAPESKIGSISREDYAATVARYVGAGDKYNPYKYTNAWVQNYRGRLYG